MSDLSPVFIRDGNAFPSALLRVHEEWGLRTVDLVNPPRRFWADQKVPSPTVEDGVDIKRIHELPTPTQLLSTLPVGDNWPAQSRRSLARLEAFFLICEDPQRRMEAREVETLSHQVSLVRHVIDSGEHLTRVLIADEVGLGKTVEVGLLLKELIDQRPGLRVLYLAPARLVSNVRREFDRLNLGFRQWTATDGDGRLTDPRLLGSIHRAVFGENFDRMIRTSPWDVVVVDECHHLSAWSPGGGDPREAFRLVRELIARQPRDGRAIFLSGTPHQGHVTRFENLLTLLKVDNEPATALSGRVIYRTKEDIRDWHGNPLFPPRQVNEPLIVDLGPEYKEWIEHIHRFYKPDRDEQRSSEARQRAADWRCAQALQWAASSPQAGLGYLVRQAIRARWKSENPVLTDALKALRPYRLGSPDEPIEELYQRIVKEVDRQQQDEDVEDIEESVDGLPTLRQGLEQLLHEGVALLNRAGDQKWKMIKAKILDPAGDEKVVLFAQPIETVIALARFLEKTTGVKPALIIGGQTDAQRQQQVESFRRADGPRFLVSSRAGGEGINLQIARRLVHIDVPWNPMDLEQRVGRVHRFGSRKTIVVDTVVVKDSRESDAYRIARQKLGVIARTLVERDRFEVVFARVMCLVPPEELQDVLINDAHSPFSEDEQDTIAQMVQKGFNNWRTFHERFGEQQRRIRHQDPGLAIWADVVRMMTEHGDAQPAEGFVSQRFKLTGGQVDAVEEPVSVIRLSDGQYYVCGDQAGAPVFGPTGESVKQLGLNLPTVAKLLREMAFPDLPTGSAQLRWPADRPIPPQLKNLPIGVLAFLRQTVRTDHQTGWMEHGCTLHCLAIDGEQSAVPLEGNDKAMLVRCIMDSTIRTKPEPAEGIIEAMKIQEKRIADELRRPSDSELQSGIRHAAVPLFAAIIAMNE
jgi:superfamily II DNA or RNA helicase